jgi:hypothetical protein
MCCLTHFLLFDQTVGWCSEKSVVLAVQECLFQESCRRIGLAVAAPPPDELVVDVMGDRHPRGILADVHDCKRQDSHADD